MIHLSTSHPNSPEESFPGSPTLVWAQLIVVLTAPSLGALCGLWFWPGPLGATLYALCKLILYGIPVYILIRQLGFAGCVSYPFQGLFTQNAAIGLVSGLVIGCVILLLWVLVLAGRVNVAPVLDAMRDNGMTNALKFLAFAAWLCLANSLLEEIVFRWYVDTRLRIIGLPFAIAVPVSAFVFTLHHVIVLSAFFHWPLVLTGSLGVFGGGVLWSLLLRYSKSLSPSWISHALVDAAIMLIGWWVLSAAQVPHQVPHQVPQA